VFSLLTCFFVFKHHPHSILVTAVAPCDCPQVPLPFLVSPLLFNSLLLFPTHHNPLLHPPPALVSPRTQGSPIDQPFSVHLFHRGRSKSIPLSQHLMVTAFVSFGEFLCCHFFTPHPLFSLGFHNFIVTSFPSLLPFAETPWGPTLPPLSVVFSLPFHPSFSYPLGGTPHGFCLPLHKY